MSSAMRDDRRLFSKREKNAVERVTGDTGHADHISPYSKGGATSVENMQLISPEGNRRKSAFKFEPRKWQSEFFEKWEKRNNSDSFLVSAVPGAGKTMAALELARRWRAAGSDRRIIIVVPSDNLRSQWQKEARLFGMQLQTKEFGTNYKTGFHGAVLTYSLVSNMVPDLRKLCSVAPTMVIFDEIHHCGEDATFGTSVIQSFELTKEKLLLSGTPWKSNGDVIPFIEYDSDGFAIADFQYSLGEALVDRVVRPIIFNHSSGFIVNDLTGDEEHVNKDIDIDDNDAKFRLKKLISSSGEFAAKQIKESHDKLVEVRRSVPDAAAMVICIDQDHARRIAKLVKRITGCTPSIIVSDESLQTDSVDAFRKSNSEWLVSVKKVSEGTDIKRLQVLCYLTNITSDLFFRQVVGRVCRWRKEHSNNEGYVFLPADPRLIKAAKDIEKLQIQALIEQSEERKVPRPDGPDQDPRSLSYSTEMVGVDVVLIGGEAVPVEIAELIKRESSNNNISMVSCWDLYKKFNGFTGVAKVEDVEPLGECLESTLDSMRKKCSKKVAQIAHKTGLEHNFIHSKSSVPFKPQKEMNLPELRNKLARLVDWVDSV